MNLCEPSYCPAWASLLTLRDFGTVLGLIVLGWFWYWLASR